jgi:hypothetical protein
MACGKLSVWVPFLSLLAFFTWIDQTSLGEFIRGSSWLFAFIEVFHLLGITLLLGSVLLVNLRLLGFGANNETVANVADDARPWIVAGFSLAVASGLCLFVSEALKCYNNPPFFIKMGLLFLAVLFTLTAHRRITRAAAATMSPAWRRTGACVSLLLWFGVGLAGRAIAFY